MISPTGRSSDEVVALLEDWLAAADDEPLLVETSGSTGAPKRVVLSRAAVVASASATSERLGGAGPWLLALSPAYVAGVMVIARSLRAGHRPTVVPAGSLADALSGAVGPAPRFCSLVPTQLHRLLDSAAETDALRSLDAVLLGGGPIDQGLRERAVAAGVHVVATYGSAETSGGCVYDGMPLPGVELAVDEPSDRIRVRGPMLFDRYDGDPALTAATLVDGWFRTADRGRIGDDGRLVVLGRVDDMIVSGGLKVPGPVVAARLREHPAVGEAEVLGVDDLEWGQRVVAFVVVAGGGAEPPSVEELRAWVAAVHPRSWAPRSVVILDAMPALATGKPDRMALRGLA